MSLFLDVPGLLFPEPIEAWAELFLNRYLESSIPGWDALADELLPLWDACELHGLAPQEGGDLFLRRLTEFHLRYADWGVIYPARNLNFGVWRMFGDPCWYRNVFQSGEIPFAQIEPVYRSLVVPYRDYVQHLPEDEPIDNGLYMLWHMLLAHQHFAPRIENLCLEILEEILAIQDGRCQWAALHGLNHLEHPDRPSVVQRYIDRYGTPESLSALEAIRDGEAM
ncbi:hypothetical protein EON81_20240 [bacterium]|nr:MAG: hypothetical protein EON81_20240 [bacterium]